MNLTKPNIMKLPRFNLTNLSIALFIFCLASTSTFSQQLSPSNTNDFWSHVRFGGGIGLSFGSGFFSGTLAPSAIYQFDQNLALGVGLIGSYAEQKNFYKSTILGASLLSMYNPIREVQLSAEFEELYVNRDFDNDFVSNQDDKYWYPALFLGAGYSAGPVTAGIRYDVLYDSDKSIYANAWMPFVRVYF